MDLRLIVSLYLTQLISSVYLYPPQVHEDVNESITTENDKRTRQPPKKNYPRFPTYSPKHFNYLSAMQQDQLKWRYMQQQKIDSRNKATTSRTRKPNSREHKTPRQNLSPPKLLNRFDEAYEQSKVAPVRIPLEQKWQVADPKFEKVSDNSNQNRKNVSEEIFTNIENSFDDYDDSKSLSRWTEVPLIFIPKSKGKSSDDNTPPTTAKPRRTNKALKPNNSEAKPETADLNVEGSELHNTQLSRREHRPVSHNSLPTSQPLYANSKIGSQKYPQINFGFNPSLNQKLLEASFGGYTKAQQEKEINVLNSLIGKDPNIQLKGLQHLLGNSPQQQAASKDIKSYTPITEHVLDISNPQNRPNIKVEYAPSQEHQPPRSTLTYHAVPNLAQIQKQFDSMANAHAQSALAKAQEESLAHVQKQHLAIAAAQEASKRKLAEIEAQSQHIANSHYPATFNHGNTQNTQLVLQAHIQNQAILQHKPEIQVKQQEFYYAHAPEITHSLAIPESVHNKQLFSPPTVVEQSKKAYGGDSDDLQYASQYAFGYKVRDYHSGNNFGHEERNDGKTAKGHYHVLLPDGRLQNVDYYADPTGFHAKVTYDNVAHH